MTPDLRALTKVRSQLAACLLTYVANLVRDLLADLKDQSKPQSADLIQPDFVSTTEFDGLSAELIEEARP